MLDTGAGAAGPADRRRAGPAEIEEDHQLAKQVAGLDSEQVIRWRSWHRWSALCLLACIYLVVAVSLDRDTYANLEIGLIPVTIPECCACCAAPSSRRPAETTPTPTLVAVATTPPAPAKRTGAGMPTQMPHRDYNEL